MVDEEKKELLLKEARKSQKYSTAKYSHFKVGASLITNDGKIFGGCNVESSSYSLTICAERVALTKALSEGSTQFEAIAIVGPHDEFCPPCGACRQLLYDYAPDLEIILTDNSSVKSFKLKDLLPHAFEETKLHGSRWQAGKK
jgi:cytidine deaminase